MNLGRILRQALGRTSTEDVLGLSEQVFNDLKMNPTQRQILDNDRQVQEASKKLTSGNETQIEEGQRLFKQLSPQKRAAVGIKVAETFERQRTRRSSEKEEGGSGMEGKF